MLDCMKMLFMLVWLISTALIWNARRIEKLTEVGAPNNGKAWILDQFPLNETLSHSSTTIRIRNYQSLTKNRLYSYVSKWFGSLAESVRCFLYAAVSNIDCKITKRTAFICQMVFFPETISNYFLSFIIHHDNFKYLL